MKRQEFVRRVCRGVLSAMACVAMATGARAGTIDVTQANFAQNRTLQNGNTYRFVEDVTFTAGSGESALKVANSATVTLEILSCATVTLKGGDAFGTIGAGAGIEVPSGSKLTIKGEGRIFATGGNAANGGNGGAGGTGVVDREYDIYRSGAGGNGGNGGGGAGAGIGGRGGNGGGGGAGVRLQGAERRYRRPVRGRADAGLAEVRRQGLRTRGGLRRGLSRG